ERRRLLEALDLHPRLGSYAAKADRIRALVALACSQLGWDDVLEPAREAAALLKADLTCGLVRDFPSLRGTVGGIYAREEGYVEAVWLGIYEHYQSRPIPQRRNGQVLAIADRLDSLVGFFGIGQVPSGSRDPFGLRRLAQGLLRIVTEAGLELDLDLLAARAVLLYGDLLDRGAETLLGELQTFLSERFRHLMGQRGFAFDEIEAAQAVSVRNLPDRVARLEALRTVREEPEFRSLVLAAKRIFNISQDSREFEVRPEELAEGAEQDLHEALSEVREVVDLAVSEGRYEDGLRAMAELVPHLDRFFADVLVMDENERLKANRIALLQACRRVFWRIARLKEMVVEKGSEATEG
ncbi:MAG: glycine--tRNA ligase subunit beta, partial [Acidobacteriota bacterium]